MTPLVNNPLKQYFRRPAIYLKLPSGAKMYDPGVVELTETGELPVYPMTAIDEITTKTPDALYNGTAMVELIKSCVPNIKNPWEINSIDFDSILIAIKSASGGNDLEIESTCPKCEETSSYGVNLVGLLSKIVPGDYETPLVIDDLKIKFRPLNYKEMSKASITQLDAQRSYLTIENSKDEEEKMQKTSEAIKNITELTMGILANTIAYIETPNVMVTENAYILDFLRNCDKQIYISIRDHGIALRASTEIQPLEIKCVNCENEYKQQFTLNISDFFG